jgi:hypothetical protein
MKYITPEDFDNAVKQPWSDKTCILQQTVMRLRKQSCWARLFGPKQWIDIDYPVANYVRQTFDWNFRNPGDEKNNPALQALRALLPLPLKASSVPHANENQ